MAAARHEGAVAAGQQGRWFGRSVIAGATTGPIGIGVALAFAASRPVKLPRDRELAIASKSPANQAEFARNYTAGVRNHRMKSALIGATAGLLVVLPFARDFSGPRADRPYGSSCTSIPLAALRPTNTRSVALTKSCAFAS